MRLAPNIQMTYQAVLCKIIPLVTFDTFFLNSLFEFIKYVIMFFSFGSVMERENSSCRVSKAT